MTFSFTTQIHGQFDWDGCETLDRSLTTTGLPNGARIRCSSATGCLVTCQSGYRLSTGGSQARTTCRGGRWTYPGLSQEPQCLAVCSPLCQNGGYCLNPEQCQCTREFTGPRCQYPMSNCNIKSVGYDGGYSCSYNSIKYSCDLYCSKKEDSITHTCEYSTGAWSPPITKCHPDVETFDPDTFVPGG